MDKVEKEFLIENIELNHFVLGNALLKVLLKSNNTLLIDLINELPNCDKSVKNIKLKCKELNISLSNSFFRSFYNWRNTVSNYLDIHIYEITTINNKPLLKFTKDEVSKLLNSDKIKNLDNEKHSILLNYTQNKKIKNNRIDAIMDRYIIQNDPILR